MLNHAIVLKGLQENNLKNIHLTIPKGKIVAFTGVSGSGKSSVVFDTIATESNRQMTLNYSQYLRNQMPRYERPRADEMKHLSPVIVIEQKAIRTNNRSTVGTYMDIHPLLRLLFSRIGMPQIEEAIDFSSQSAFGKCPTCNGYGEVITPDVNRLIDFNQSLADYAVQFKPLSPAGWQGRWMITGGLFDPHKKIKDFSAAEKALLIDGPPADEKVFAPFHTKNGPQPHEWDGLIPRFTRLYINRDISKLRQVSEEDVLQMTIKKNCETCEGSGLSPEVLASKINGLNIAQCDQLQLDKLREQLENITDPLGTRIVEQMIPKINQLIELGLSYLHLARPMNTLSGGEAQRVKIARHLGSSLNQLIYIFDEPTAGLHEAEIPMLLHMMNRLKENDNTVLVVEHNESVIENADEVIELGPGAGALGGEVVFQGPPHQLNDSLARTMINSSIEMKRDVREAVDFFTLEHVTRHHLKNISINIPKHVLVSVCGVSGSGKSTLMLDVFLENNPEAIWVSQEPIGISSRSTIATYMGIMDDIRRIMAKETNESPGLFSFNSIGACSFCGGKGEMKPDVAFADPVTMTCESCHGLRYSKEALSHTYKGLTIADILQLTIQEAQTYFSSEKIKRQLTMLTDVGMDYLTLGQTTSTLSGGELQRLKLASHLQQEGNVYVLDEPSLGLHRKDKEQLLKLFETLVEQGNSVIIIEHDLAFIARSDWVIELGPTGGIEGGYVLFEGKPQQLLTADTPTARVLNVALNK
ncbi:MAG TPA: ATP-binding cassette domain-containing protein [Bacillota bacterium]|nr:ATP-binding cassette domain-containing protein [Bacillota bacterium]